MSDSEWGPWIEHDGRKFPYGEMVPVIVEIQTEVPDESKIVEGHSGDCMGAWLRVILGRPYILRYRIRKPKGLTILRDILREVEREPEMV